MTVVVRRSEGLNGALRGRGFGPWIEAVIFREDVGGISVEDSVAEDEGISRYAEPEAEGMMDVCKTNWAVSILMPMLRKVERMALHLII